MSKAVELSTGNPEIEVCVSDPSYAWIRIHGTAVFEDNMAVKEGAMNTPS